MWERLAPRTLTAAPSIPTDSLDPADSPDTAIPPTEEEIRLGFIKESVTRYTSIPRPFPGRVTLFRPLEAPPGHAGFSCDDPFNGLVPLVGPGIAVVPVPGNHSTMVWEAGLRVTAAGLEEGMRRGTGIGKG